MIELEKWSSFSRKLPLVAVVGLMGEWMTIYACLQQAIKNFDYVIVVGDGVSPEAKTMFDRFMSDHSQQVQGRVNFVELGDLDPWPWLVMPRPGVEYKRLEDVPIKSWSKAGFKRFNYARAVFPNSILCSLHSDVVVFDDTGSRIRDRMANIEDPFFDSEWFSMVSMQDRTNIEKVIFMDSTPDNIRVDHTLKQRTLYDYPGDWGLMGYYASSMLTVGPDPVGHEAECFYPWSRTTQCEKKGCDMSVPHAVHFEWLRDRYKDMDFGHRAWRIVKRDWIEKNDVELGNRLTVIDNAYFPVKFGLDVDNILRIEL